MSVPYALIADIGGTNARFALVNEETWDIFDDLVLPCAEYPGLIEAATDYLQKVGMKSVTHACFPLACPVDVDLIKLTNNHWQFTRDQLIQAFDLEKLHLINDFTAMALGMLEVPEEGFTLIKSGTPKADTPRVVIGPGTGLGVSGLVPFRDEWRALSTEGGHVSFAPTDELSIEILKILQKQFGRVSVERILSGQGLVNLYQAMAQIFDIPLVSLTPAQISQKALEGDKLAAQVLTRFCRVLGEVTGDSVLKMGGVGGVYLCGGILPRMVDFLIQSEFVEAFLAKGRAIEFIANVPVQLCIHKNPGLLGAAAYVRQYGV